MNKKNSFLSFPMKNCSLFFAEKWLNDAVKTLCSEIKFFSLNCQYFYITNVTRSLYSLEIVLKLKKL